MALPVHHQQKKAPVHALEVLEGEVSLFNEDSRPCLQSDHQAVPKGHQTCAAAVSVSIPDGVYIYLLSSALRSSSIRSSKPP